MIRDRLQEPDTKAGFILDGFPRNLAQARALEGVLQEVGQPLDAVCLLDVDFDILMKRLTGRRTCSKTGKLLNIYFSSPEELDECIEAGGELVQREDDNEETIGNRLSVYRESTEPLIKYYEKRNKLTRIDAEGTVDEVYDRLVSALS